MQQVKDRETPVSGKLEKVARAAQEWRKWRRKRIVIPTTDRAAVVPSVFIWVPDFARPTGGVRVMYRHVDILNDNGIPAAVMHQRRGFRCTWFANTTRVVSAKDVAIGPTDLLVVGELDVDLLVRLNVPVQHVVLNQSGHLTWDADPGRVAEYYRSAGGPRAILTVSDFAADLLRFAFPRSDVRRVRIGLDIETFAPQVEDPARRLTYMPRRGAADLQLVMHLLANTTVLDGWEVRSLHGLSHDAVRSELQQSRVFLSLSPQEGFGLPAAEAMACGNYVIGYHGQGGREFFLPEFSSPVETSDVLAAARAVQRSILLDNESPGWLRSRGLAASEHVRRTYSPANERADVIAAYSDLIEHGPLPGVGRSVS
jgi:hypothetical protein